MSEALKGKTKEEAKVISENYYNMITDKEWDDDMDMGDAQAYQGIAKFPARTKCATISWRAFGQTVGIDEE